MSYLAIVKVENNRIAKYQDFESESDANAHISTHGGFVVETPAAGHMDYWVINEGAKIGAGSVLTQDVQKYSLVYGVPAKKIRDLR